MIVFVAAYDDGGEEYIQHYFATETTAREWLEKERVKQLGLRQRALDHGHSGWIISEVGCEAPSTHPHHWGFSTEMGDMYVIRPQEILTELPEELPVS